MNGDIMSKSVVLSLCDYTGNMVRPWAEAGYNCICVDLRHEETKVKKYNGTVRFVKADIRYWLPPLAEYRIVFAAPPCTHLAVSGARWFKNKGLRALLNGLELVERCRQICEWSGAPWILENPVSTLSTYWRKPDYIFDPYEYAGYLSDPAEEIYTKKTCLWTGGGFVMPKRRPVEIAKIPSKMHLLPPSNMRSAMRAVTPMGFAYAVYEANQEQGNE